MNIDEDKLRQKYSKMDSKELKKLSGEYGFTAKAVAIINEVLKKRSFKYRARTPKQASKEFAGTHWEHEGFLIGNKPGLKMLLNSINDALENEQSDINVGDFCGVKCLDDKFFTEKEEEEESGSLASIAIVLIFGIIIIFTFIGIVTVIKWLI